MPRGVALVPARPPSYTFGGLWSQRAPAPEGKDLPPRLARTGGGVGIVTQE